MKRSIKSRYQMLLIIFFTIFVVESVLVLFTVIRPIGLPQLKSDLQSVLIIFFFIQFIFFIVLLYYIPYLYDRSLREIDMLIQEISEGKYEVDLELKTHNQSAEVVSLMTALQRMMNIIIRFDTLKGDKIYEHHQRLMTLVHLIPQGCLVVTVVGEIVYMNDFIKDNFPELAENLNIMETLLPEYLEDNLKPIILHCMQNGESLKGRSFKLPESGLSYRLDCGIVRNRKGQPAGAVFIIVKA